MEKIKYDINDPNIIEVIRSVIFNRLKRGGWEQLSIGDTGFDDYFDFGQNISRARDNIILKVQEIFWQLISQGVITPGINISNPNLPWFRLTDYGRKVIEEERFMPHDPTNYINNYKKMLARPNSVVISYLEESLRCFTVGCMVASTMMLGIASEVAFLNLCKVLLSSLKNQEEKSKLSKIIASVSMVAKLNYVRDKIEQVVKNKKGALPEDTMITMLSIFDLVRRQRNDVGHPQEEIPVLTRDQVFIYLRVFPHYCRTIQAVEDYLSKNKI